MERRHIESLVFLVLLLGMLALAMFMLLPFLNMIILAAVCAFLFSGMYERLVRIVHNRSLAAFLMTVAVVIGILVPLSFAGYRILDEGTDLYSSLKDQASGQHISALLTKLQAATHSYIPATQIDAQAVNERLQQVLQWIVGHLGSVFTGITRPVLNFAFFLLFFYYLVRDGEKLKRRAMTLSPLSDTHEQQIINRIAIAVSGTVRGQIVLSFIQGIVASCGFAFFGIPNPILWGSVVVLASFVPIVGTSLVLIPAILYLAATGQWPLAFGLTIWGMLAVGLIDNALGPKLMSHGAKLHPMVIMIFVLGGIEMFGPVGILIGPIVVSILFALFDIYLSVLQPSAPRI